ncbi:MAG: hypothetical protein NXI04_21780 [Planctomycetaceae bacterium]|nr:hypothetical protein [Planctomycetaceae bacterium]
MSDQKISADVNSPESPHFSTESDPQEQIPAWTEVEEGRFMPRRVRGSSHGRALG